MTPLTPFRIGCKPCVYRGSAPLHPQTKKILCVKFNLNDNDDEDDNLNVNDNDNEDDNEDEDGS